MRIIKVLGLICFLTIGILAQTGANVSGQLIVESKVYSNIEIKLVPRYKFAQDKTYTAKTDNEGNYSFSLKATKAPITNSISTVKKFTLRIDASYNNMNINVEAIEPINCDLFLYDLNGKILSKMGPINLITGNNDLNIPIKELSEGIYFINLKTKNESQNKKFMVKPY